MHSLDLREKLDEGILVGAVGTLLADRGVAQPYNEANPTHPRIVQAFHEESLHAAAGVVQTNIFAANRLKLAAYGLEDKAREISVEGARLAFIRGEPKARS